MFKKPTTHLLLPVTLGLALAWMNSTHAATSSCGATDCDISAEDNINLTVDGGGTIDTGTVIITDGSPLVTSQQPILDVQGTASIDQDLIIDDDLSVGDALDVAGTTTLNTLSVTGTSSFIGTMTAGNIDSATLDTAGNVTVGGTLGITGNTSLSTLSTTSNTTVGGNLGVTGTSSFTGDMTAGNITATNIDSTTLDTSGNATVGGTLGVTGNTSLSTLSTTSNTTVGGNLGVTGTSSFTGDMTAGNITATNIDSTTLDTSGNATVGGTLGVTGATTLSDNLGVAGNTSVGGDLSVTGTTTLDGATTVNSSLSVDSNGATAGGNTLTVDGASISMASGTNSITLDDTNGTFISGNAEVDGDLRVNGNIIGLNPTAISGITVGENTVQVDGANNEVYMVADDNNTPEDGRGNFSLTNTNAALTVTNSSGNTHGLTVTESYASLSGGTDSTSLTLDDIGATFENTTTGGPARVTGIADGRYSHDAVNMRQLRQAHAGIASAAALAAIPQVQPGKSFNFGIGYGHFEGENAVALGMKAAYRENMSFTGGISRSSGNTTVNAGWGISW
jgi:hypothetical protein